jgi:hypothetical protein
MVISPLFSINRSAGDHAVSSEKQAINNGQAGGGWSRQGALVGSSRPEESHLEALTEPCVSLSTHTALTTRLHEA